MPGVSSLACLGLTLAGTGWEARRLLRNSAAAGPRGWAAGTEKHLFGRVTSCAAQVSLAHTAARKLGFYA